MNVRSRLFYLQGYLCKALVEDVTENYEEALQSYKASTEARLVGSNYFHSSQSAFELKQKALEVERSTSVMSAMRTCGINLHKQRSSKSEVRGRTRDEM